MKIGGYFIFIRICTIRFLSFLYKLKFSSIILKFEIKYNFFYYELFKYK